MHLRCLLGLIFWRMWKRAFVLQHLSKVATVDPSVTKAALDEMLSLIGWLFTKALTLHGFLRCRKSLIAYEVS